MFCMDGSREGLGAEGRDKMIVFRSNTGADSLEKKNSIQCIAIIGPPAKRHLNDDVRF